MSSRGSKFGGRSKFSNRNRGDRRQQHPEGKRQKTEENVDETSPIIQAFLGFREELDSRNDRYERIVKLSRDITIESKRIIFLLQRVAGSSDKESLLDDAEAKLAELHKSKFLPLAQELEGQDPFQFLRAFSPGLQEYIEAATFYHYLSSESLVGIDKIQAGLTFPEGSKGTVPEGSDDTPTLVQSTIKQMTDLSAKDQESQQATPVVAEEAEENFQSRDGDASTGCKTVPISPTEYMLGVADFTGELMRMAINSVGAGDLETPSVVTEMMRHIHDAFTAFNNTPRELRHKTRVLSQSLQKVERACYTLKVRGSEIPKHMLADVFSGGNALSQDAFVTDDAGYLSD